jgi:hypothetical protein
MISNGGCCRRLSFCFEFDATWIVSLLDSAAVCRAQEFDIVLAKICERWKMMTFRMGRAGLFQLIPHRSILLTLIFQGRSRAVKEKFREFHPQKRVCLTPFNCKAAADVGGLLSDRTAGNQAAPLNKPESEFHAHQNRAGSSDKTPSAICLTNDSYNEHRDANRGLLS